MYLILMYKLDLALNNCWLMLDWIIRKRTAGSFNCVSTKYVYKSYIWYICKNRIWVLNNQQWLIRPKTKRKPKHKINPNRNLKNQIPIKANISFVSWRRLWSPKHVWSIIMWNKIIKCQFADLFILICILSSTDRLFRGITTHQCG